MNDEDYKVFDFFVFNIIELKLVLRVCVGFLDILEFIFWFLFLVFSDIFSIMIVKLGYFVIGSMFLLIFFSFLGDLIGRGSLVFLLWSLMRDLDDLWFSMVGVVFEYVFK